MFALYNTNMQTSTFIPVSTTQAAMPAGQSQVVVRIPQKTGFVVSGIMVLDSTATLTSYGVNGIVNTSQGPYGLQRNLIGFIAGDLSGGVPLPTCITSTGPAGAAAAVQMPGVIASQSTAGALFINTFGLASDSDVTLLVDTARCSRNQQNLRSSNDRTRQCEPTDSTASIGRSQDRHTKGYS
jgi:hypothetical protein